MASNLRTRIKYWKEQQNKSSPVTIQEAAEELKPFAFRLWMQLMLVVDPNALFGMRNLCKISGLSAKRTREILNELRRKGYVSWEVKQNGLPMQLAVVRRAKLVGRDNFIKLSNVLLDMFPDNERWEAENMAVVCCPDCFRFFSRIVSARKKAMNVGKSQAARDFERVIAMANVHRDKNCISSACQNRCWRILRGGVRSFNCTSDPQGELSDRPVSSFSCAGFFDYCRRRLGE